MDRIMRHLTTAVAITLFAASSATAQEYAKATEGTRLLQNEGSDFSIKVLVEASNLGSGEVEIGEITFPAGSEPRNGHAHTSIEIFYILSGELDHIVNGESHLLGPGMVGIVRPGDDVIHRVPSATEPVRALVIWAPGGEVERLSRFFTSHPVSQPNGG